VDGGLIARWEVRPLHRSRRGIEERLFLATPWLVLRSIHWATRARAGSPFRRALFSRLLRAGFAAVERGD
jgi:hypothetical protein